MPRRRKDKDPVPVMPQQFTWKTTKTFNNYDDADEYAKSIEPDHIKIKRRKDCFDVRVGTPVKKN